MALWSQDIEALEGLCERHFGAKANVKYVHEKKKTQAHFLTFASSARLELMQRPGLKTVEDSASDDEFMGCAHLAMSVGSQEAVDKITARLVEDAFICSGGPRTRGDGYYESVVADPKGNRIKITV